MTTTHADVLTTTTRPANLNVTYFLVLTAAGLGLSIITPSNESTTFLVITAAWGLLSLLMRPGIHTAGQGLVVTMTAMLLVRNYADLDAQARLWGLLALAIVALPFIFRPLRTVDGFPFLHFYCLMQGMYVYVSVLFAAPSSLYATTYPLEIRTVGFRTLALFQAMVVGGGAIVGALLRHRQGNRPAARPDSEPVRFAARGTTVARAYILLIACVGLLAFTAVTHTGTALGQVTFLLKLGLLGAWLVLVLGWMNGTLMWWHKPIVMIVPLLWMVSTVGDTLLFLTAFPGFLLLAIWIGQRRQIPWMALVFALVALIVVNTGKGELRRDVRNGVVESDNAALGVSWLEHATESVSEGRDRPLENSAWRFSNSDLLGYVTTYVPDRYPYYGYSPYTSLPTLLIPRALAPDKPAFGFANEFGRRYELLGRSDYTTSLNTPLPTEAMVIGGYLPLVVVGFLVGGYFRLLQRLFRSRRAASVITGSLLCIQVVLAVDSNILSIVLMLPYGAALYLALRWVCGAGSASADEALPLPALERPPPRSAPR